MCNFRIIISLFLHIIEINGQKNLKFKTIYGFELLFNGKNGCITRKIKWNGQNGVRYLEFQVNNQCPFKIKREFYNTVVGSSIFHDAGGHVKTKHIEKARA